MRNIEVVISTAALIALAPLGAEASKGYMVPGKGDMANCEKIFKQGKGDVPACISCHGEDGTGNDDMGTPRLAGQHYAFLVKQLEDFAADRRTDTTMFVMNTNAKGLTPEDRRDVATYLSSKHVEFEGSDLEGLKKNGIEVGESYKGRALVEYGSPVRNDGFPKELGAKGPGIAACKSCHDYGGRGAPPVYPMIGKQRYVYLVNQLKMWRDKNQNNKPKKQKHTNTHKMSDADIHDAAAYLTNAHPTTPGFLCSPFVLCFCSFFWLFLVRWFFVL